MARRRNKRVRQVQTRGRRRRNPATRTNPSGFMGIITGGFWVGAGMWAGGLIGGIIPQFGSGLIGGVLHGALTAYGVAWLGSRFTRNAGLMAAGAFAGTAMGLLSGVLGGAGSIVSGITGGGSHQMVGAPEPAGGGAHQMVGAPEPAGRRAA